MKNLHHHIPSLQFPNPVYRIQSVVEFHFYDTNVWAYIKYIAVIYRSQIDERMVYNCYIKECIS